MMGWKGGGGLFKGGGGWGPSSPEHNGVLMENHPGVDAHCKCVHRGN